MNTPSDLRYQASHEWARLAETSATVGITDLAQDQLGDVVNVDLPAVGAKVSAGAAFGSVDSVKATSELIAPVSGEVTAVNEALVDAPELINTDPYGEGWMIEILMAAPAEAATLLDADAYAAACEAGAH